MFPRSPQAEARLRDDEDSRHSLIHSLTHSLTQKTKKMQKKRERRAARAGSTLLDLHFINITGNSTGFDRSKGWVFPFLGRVGLF